MFARTIILIIGFLALFTTVSMAQTIGVSLPLSGDFKELGEKFRKGVELAFAASDQSTTLVFVDDACDPDSAIQAANTLLERKAEIAIGFMCSDAAIVAASKLQAAQTPLIIAGARSVRLIKDRDRESWNLWRMVPGDDYPVTAAAQAIAKQWRDVPFALVDDGTIYGRNFTDQLRFKLDDLGLRPQFSDTFRAAQSTQAGLLRRLERSGITSVLIASATLEDLQTIAIDNARLGINLNIMATEALASLPYLETASEIPSGIQMIGWPLLPVPELEAALKEENLLPDQILFDGYASLQIALQALGNTPNETQNRLQQETFQTILGQIGFNADGSSTFNPYQLLQWDGEVFSPAENLPETQ